jgi:hypothetical protein
MNFMTLKANLLTFSVVFCTFGTPNAIFEPGCKETQQDETTVLKSTFVSQVDESGTKI